MVESYISVTQLNNYIRNIFNSEIMLQNICVYGEVSSYNISNGIAYFNLKDENGLLSCVLFGANNFTSPKIGDMVLVTGSMSYYVKGGKLSFNATTIMPYGKGLLYEKFLKLKQKLEDLGYFSSERKKTIPSKVKRIGVVTSESGAVIRDIIDVTRRRNDTIDIVVYPVKVQGVGAEVEIAKGINFFSSYDNVDVIIVARGGGSLEDLEPFNTELVANAVYDCKKPLVSAVGHETDFTIIDFVADLRAPTPSAAAEIIAWEKQVMIDQVDGLLYDIGKIIYNMVVIKTKDCELLFQKIENSSNAIVNNAFLKILSYENKILKFEDMLENIFSLIEKLEIKLENLNPKHLSNMGYSKVIQNNIVINQIRKINNDDEFTLSMIDGNIQAKVVK